MRSCIFYVVIFTVIFDIVNNMFFRFFDLLEKKIVLLHYTVFVLVSLLIFSVFGTFKYVTGEYFLAGCVFALAGGFVSGWLLVYFECIRDQIVYWISSIVFLGAMVYLTCFCEENKGVLLWTLSGPWVLFYTLGRFWGVGMTVLGGAVFAFVFYVPLPLFHGESGALFNFYFLVVYFTGGLLTLSHSSFCTFLKTKLEEINCQLRERVEQGNAMKNSLAACETRYRAIYSQITEGVLLIDNLGTITESNPQMEKMLGYEDGELIGRNVFSLMSRNDLLEVSSKLDKLISGKTIVLKRRMRSKSGIYISCEQRGQKIGDNLMLLLYRDVTERNIAELALERVNKTLDNLAHLDGLTGVANRQKMDLVLENEWKKAIEISSPIGLILADIDYFKEYNDFYGHQAGDEALIRVAGALKDLVHKPHDLVVRYGGDEFVIVLPCTGEPGCRIIAEKMRTKIENMMIPHEKSECSDYLTMSLGLRVHIPTHGCNVEDFIASACQAVSKAKKNGRNQVG